MFASSGVGLGSECLHKALYKGPEWHVQLPIQAVNRIQFLPFLNFGRKLLMYCFGG